MTPIGKKERSTLIGRLASGLKYPQLAALLGLLFLVDLFIPDPIPLLDEAILGLLTVFLATWRKKRGGEEEPSLDDMKNVTPPKTGGSRTGT